MFEGQDSSSSSSESIKSDKSEIDDHSAPGYIEELRSSFPKEKLFPDDDNFVDNGDWENLAPYVPPNDESQEDSSEFSDEDENEDGSNVCAVENDTEAVAGHNSGVFILPTTDEEERTKKIEAKNALEIHLSSMKKMIKGATDDDKKKAEEAMEQTVGWLDSNQFAEAHEYEENLKELKQMSDPIIAKTCPSDRGGSGGGGSHVDHND